MTTRRGIGNLLAMVAMVVANVLPPSWFTKGLKYVASAYILGGFLLLVRTGVRRRRPYWTAESWRRFLAVCAVPVGALVIMVCMMTALELRWPIAGVALSHAREVWIVIMMFFMIVGTGGLVIMISRFADGEPTRQFALPEWLTRRRRVYQGGSR